MKRLFKFKPIQFKKPDYSELRKEWSWPTIRRYFCTYPKLWLGMPIVAILAFAILYVISILSDFDVVPLRQGIAAAFTSAFGYMLGIIGLSGRKIEEEKLGEEYNPTPKQKVISKIATSVILVLALALLAYLEIDEIIADKRHILETIMTILTILFAALPSVLVKLLNK